MIKANKGKIIIGFMCMFAVLFLSLVIMSPDASAATCKHTTKGTRVKTAATCTSSGKRETYCTACGKITSTSTIPASGHNYNISATCTSPKKCKCGATSGSALGHSPGYINVINAKCTTSGKRETYCSRCNILYSSSTIPAPGHNWTTETVSPSCTKTGYTRTYCTRCNTNSSYHETGKLGHNYSSPTCIEAQKCRSCGTPGASALGHDYAPATCTESGKCRRCGLKGSPATGHTPNLLSPKVTPATCTKEGKRETLCKKCGGIVYTETLAKLPHTKDFPNTKVTPATSTSAGKIEIFCKTCNMQLVNISIPKNNDNVAAEMANRSDMIGRLVIPSIDINLALYNGDGNGQGIVNNFDSAHMWQYNVQTAIGDHNWQGFWKIKNAVPNETIAYINNGTSVDVYVCVKIGSAFPSDNNIYLIDEDGHDIWNENSGGIIMMTCDSHKDHLDILPSYGVCDICHCEIRYEENLKAYTLWQPVECVN